MDPDAEIQRERIRDGMRFATWLSPGGPKKIIKVQTNAGQCGAMEIRMLGAVPPTLIQRGIMHNLIDDQRLRKLKENYDYISTRTTHPQKCEQKQFVARPLSLVPQNNMNRPHHRFSLRIRPNGDSPYEDA